MRNDRGTPKTSAAPGSSGGSIRLPGSRTPSPVRLKSDSIPLPKSGSAAVRAPPTRPSPPSSGSRKPASTTTSRIPAPSCREETQDLAARKRTVALELLDNAIEKIVPHVNGDITIETKTDRGTMTVEAWQARMQGCAALVKLLDRKAKLLGMDAAIKVEPPPVVVPESEEARARAREALKTWLQVFCQSSRFPGQRPRLMITLERLKEVLSYNRYSGEFTWKDMHVVARARGATRRPGPNNSAFIPSSVGRGLAARKSGPRHMPLHVLQATQPGEENASPHPAIRWCVHSRAPSCIARRTKPSRRQRPTSFLRDQSTR